MIKTIIPSHLLLDLLEYAKVIRLLLRQLLLLSHHLLLRCLLFPQLGPEGQIYLACTWIRPGRCLLRWLDDGLDWVKFFVP